MWTDIYRSQQKPVSRRAMLRAAGCGFGFLGLAGMLAEGATSPDNPLAVRQPHFEPKAKRVIFLFMHGGPSSVDTFDPKPRLTADDGKPLPFKRPLAFAGGTPGPLMKSPWAFKQYGQSGIPVSDLFPHVGSCADDLCVIRSMVGEGVDHGAALLQSFTGSSTFTRTSMGSWVLYGLGTENQNLPGFITILSGGKTPDGGKQLWGSGFLPSVYQGVQCRSHGEPVLYLENPPSVSRPLRRS